MYKFKQINIHPLEAPQKNLTPDNIYWKKLGIPILVKEYGAIDYIDFSPVEPYHFAVTCSVRVQIYNPITKLVTKNLSRFQENAYGGTFRRDGKLLVAGDEESYVKLFDVSSRHILRSFKGHKGAVHRTFFTSDLLHIASFSDDKTVKVWDIPTEKPIHTFSEHTDYIRAGCVSSTSPNIILSGGYDGIIKMYDTRTNKSVCEVKHGSPIETLIMLPTDGIFISGGGTEINVYDAFMGGKLYAKISQHHKTVTCLKLASEGKRLLSSSLDRHVKIYDIATYQPVHNIDLPNSILSMGISAHDTTLVAGMVDGLVSIHQRDSEDIPVKENSQNLKKFQTPYDENLFDVVIPEHIKQAEQLYNKHLRKYNYTKALDIVLRPPFLHRPHVAVALIQELIRRKGLERAFIGRDHANLLRIVNFFTRYIGDVRFTKILLDATDILLNVYEGKFEEFTGELGQRFICLAERLTEEQELTLKCLELQGKFELIVAGSTVSSTEVEHPKLLKLQPSESANRHSVIMLK